MIKYLIEIWQKVKGNLLVDLLEEGDLLLQRLDASLQIQTSQSGSVHILRRFGKSQSCVQLIIWYLSDQFYHY